MKRMMTLPAAIAAVFLAASLAIAQDFKLGEIDILNPEARAMIPGVAVGTGYLTITNNGASDDRLVAVTTPGAGRVDIHEMTMDGDIMRMGALPEGLPVPAGETVEMKKGGLHLMFLNVTQPFKEGDSVKARLEFEKAGAIDIEFRVVPANPAMDDHGDHAAD